jgi:NAD(P)-dependent dehydrogenase (short-subunit alcohol dehydrogenase family)
MLLKMSRAAEPAHSNEGDDTHMTDLTGKVALITGATNGIGEVTARELARMGAHVVVVGRSREKTERVVQTIQAETGSTAVTPLLADLSLQREVRRLADEFQARFQRLDLLINNAGATFEKRYVTAEGLEMTFALNHLAYFLLSALLLDVLKQTAAQTGEARIVNVASTAHRTAALDFDDLQAQKRYIGFVAYGRSKLANLLFTFELARRLQGTGVTVNAIHPGGVRTGFAQNDPGITRLLWNLLTPFLRTPEQGAETLIHVATDPALRGRTGGYYADNRLTTASAAAQDVEAQRRLWAASEALVAQSAAAQAG